MWLAYADPPMVTMVSFATVSFGAETTGNVAVSPAGNPGDHAACDAEIARLRAEIARLRAEIARLRAHVDRLE
jgi:ubiquinone biosynthesis protein UbiJ